MDCPNCKHNLSQLKYNNLNIDFCSRCKGIWFDRGEMRLFIEELLQDSSRLKKEQLKLAHKITLPHHLHELLRTCPKCMSLMKKENYSYDSNVMIDRCPECNGIWIDRGEIKKIAIYSKNSESRITFRPEAIANEHRERCLDELLETVDRFRNPVFFLAMLTGRVLPVSDDNPTGRFPKMTLTIIILNMMIFMCQVFFVSDIDAFYNFLGSVPAFIISGRSLFTLITSMFIHGGIWHLVGNMFYLWLFGNNVEGRLGSLRFLFYYIFFGILADMSHILVNAGSMIPAIGASGAISGIMGAYMVLFPRVKLTLYIFYWWQPKVPAYAFLGCWTIIQMIQVIFSIPGTFTGVAWWSHIGGFVSGLLITKYVKDSISEPNLKVPE